MLNWLKKAFVTFVAVLTFGTVVPPSHAPTDRSQTSKSNRLENSTSDIDTRIEKTVEEEDQERPENRLWAVASWQEVAATISEAGELRERLKKYTVVQADKQGLEKFGTVIAGQVGEEYREEILPKVEKMMETVSAETDDETLRSLEISDTPSGGVGEKIFHIYDTRSGEDLVRFHVRRDHPPQEGYWFNFHYHLPSDHFLTHYDLGNIYWDKDTPPRWMS